MVLRPKWISGATWFWLYPAASRQARSPFSFEQPPDRLPPPGVRVVIGWELAAQFWRHHLPQPLTDRYRCAACGLRVPCLGWRFADAFLADALRPSGVDEQTREL